MILKKTKAGKKYCYEYFDSFSLEKALENKTFSSIRATNKEDRLTFSFKTDPKFASLRLLVILSPIFISIFDSGKTDLEFFVKTLEESNFKYGLYEKFFQDFSFDTYLTYYQNHQANEDIIVDKNLNVDFTVNMMDDVYILALNAMIESLILDKRICDKLLTYFSKMRNDIVINGRRSILANSIQAFYLSKYVVIWALDLYKIIENNHPKLYPYILPIYELTNNLKTPSMVK
ncbi:MAG: hypothetical protein PUG67_04690 [Peptoniphilaceae bacterium]|nr:hypothetical protein [Peptoniphilaceae bacterium]MDY6018446.1 hypothetical protein [Anaerococcus sp.]